MLYSYGRAPHWFWIPMGCRIYLVSSTFFRLWLQSSSYQIKTLLVLLCPVFRYLAATQYISVFKYTVDLSSFTHFFIHAFTHALRTSKWIWRIFLKKLRISIKWRYFSKFIKQQPSVKDNEQSSHSLTVQSTMHHV